MNAMWLLAAIQFPACQSGSEVISMISRNLNPKPLTPEP